MRNYKKIHAWQLADQLVVDVYLLTKQFPKDEIYALTNQLRRSIVSVATNIAEGATRQHKKDYLNFLYVARASLVEAEYLLSLAHRFQYIEKKSYEQISLLVDQTQSKLYGLLKSVEVEV